MSDRRNPFIIGEYYHLYNRGVDKRDIVLDQFDCARFVQSVGLMNSVQTIGSIYEHAFTSKRLGSEASKSKPLVSFVAFCLNPNHYHFLVTPCADKGIERFMQRLGTAYTKFFNNKYKRTGALFSGIFQSEYISDDEQLRQVSAYINYNDRIHGIAAKRLSLVRKSIDLFAQPTTDQVLSKINYDPSIILDNFKNNEEYLKYAKEIADSIKEWRSQKDEELFPKDLFGSEASK